VKVELTESQVRNLKALLQNVSSKIQTETRNNPKLADNKRSDPHLAFYYWFVLVFFGEVRRRVAPG
jgi:hypothetical protein